MFAETAREVVRILGKEPLARGVITQEQMADAVQKIARALAGVRGEARPAEAAGELPVSLAQRLVPFLELLQRTQDDDGYVMWEAAAAFGAD